MKKVIYTGNIPQCPYCMVPTMRNAGASSTTLMYFPPSYNEQGENVNPDRNTITTPYHCNSCNKDYKVASKGWKNAEYINLDPPTDTPV